MVYTKPDGSEALAEEKPEEAACYRDLSTPCKP
jgi:hypothetical protein